MTVIADTDQTSVPPNAKPDEHAELEAQLPPLYARWLKDILPSAVPAERHATCSDCAMCASTRSSVTYNDRVFKPDVKCCSFHPTLPNFLVGSILRDGALEQSMTVIETRIAAGVGVTPLGVEMPEDYGLIYNQNRSALFGRSKAMRCPHFIDESGQCGIYQHRNAVCSTFQCKYVRGAVGQRFWKRLLALLTAVEHGLAKWCLDRMGMELDVVERLLERRKTKKESQAKISAEEMDQRVGEHYRRSLWGGHWFGREREFYLAASDAVNDLSWSDVRTICGIDAGLAASLLQGAHDRLLDRRLPDRLLFNATMRPHGEMLVRLTGYSADDQVVVPRQLADMLTLFDGVRSTDDVRARLRTSGVSGIGLDFLQTLVDFQILVAA